MHNLLRTNVKSLCYSLFTNGIVLYWSYFATYYVGFPIKKGYEESLSLGCHLDFILMLIKQIIPQTLVRCDCDCARGFHVLVISNVYLKSRDLIS